MMYFFMIDKAVILFFQPAGFCLKVAAGWFSFSVGYIRMVNDLAVGWDRARVFKRID
jgi:hypothetical protein